MELTDSARNAILQTAIIRVEEGKRGAPASFTPEEKACYEGFEEQILSDLAKGMNSIRDRAEEIVMEEVVRAL